MIREKSRYFRLNKTVGTLISAVVLLSACGGDPIGTACEFRGSGFHASTNCRYQCLQVRTIECPSGEKRQPAICSGVRDCEPGSCDEGQVCYHAQDPFNKESYCVPDTICGVLEPQQLSDWESANEASAATLREAYAVKMKRRREATTTAAPHEP